MSRVSAETRADFVFVVDFSYDISLGNAGSANENRASARDSQCYKLSNWYKDHFFHRGLSIPASRRSLSVCHV